MNQMMFLVKHKYDKEAMQIVDAFGTSYTYLVKIIKETTKRLGGDQ